MFSTQYTRVFFGGSSSGKSWFILSQELPLSVLSEGRNYIVARKVGATNRKSTYNQVLKGIEILGLSEFFRVNKTEQTITCTYNNSQIFFVGLDDPEKLKSITPHHGVITDVVMEEATEFDYADYKQLTKRLRGIGGGHKKRFTICFNPIYKSHWIYKEFFIGCWDDNSRIYCDDKKLILKTTYIDNLNFLATDDVYQLENEKDPYWYEVYTLGNFGVLSGVIFKNWRIEDFAKSRHFSDVRFGVDFGFTNDPTVFLCVAIEGKTIYVYNELYEAGLQIDDLSRTIKPITQQGTVWCDSAEPRSIAAMKMHGLRAEKVSKSFSKTYRLQLMQQYEIVFDSRCKHGPEEFSLYSWREDKYGLKSNEPEDRNDHCADALYYAIEKYLEYKYGEKGRIINQR